MKHSVRIRVESGDFARVIDPGDLGHFDSVVERLSRIVHKRVLSGFQVVQESMLVGSRIAIIAHRDPIFVDAEDLREDERCARFAGDGRDGRIGDRSTGKLAVLRLRHVSHKTMVLPVCASIETYNFAFLADTLSIDGVRAGGGIDSNETVALVAGQEVAGHLSIAGVLTYDVAVVVNPKGSRGRPSVGNKRLYRSVSQEEGIPVSIRADYIIGAIDSERQRCDTPVDVEKRNSSENIAKEVVESPVVIDVKSDSNSSVERPFRLVPVATLVPLFGPSMSRNV